MNRLLLCLAGSFLFLNGMAAQENLDYQKPPQEILELIDVPLAPSTLIDSDAEMMIFLYRDQFKSIAELSEEELRLGKFILRIYIPDKVIRILGRRLDTNQDLTFIDVQRFHQTFFLIF